MEKPAVSTHEHAPPRRGSLTSSLTIEAGGPTAAARDIHYVDHREGDDRVDAAKGRDSAAIEGKYWLSANFIGTLLAIGFSFMAGIGGETLCPFRRGRVTLCKG